MLHGYRRNDVLSYLDRIFGRDVVRNYIKQHGLHAVAAVGSALYRQYMDWQPTTPVRVGYTPKGDPPTYRSQRKSPSFERVKEGVKRKLEFREYDSRPVKEMARRRKAHIGRTGTYQGSFKKTKRVKGATYWDAVCKDERRAAPTSSECTYVVHCTHPGKYVLRMIGMAMVKRLFEKVGVKIRAWTDLAGAEYVFGGGTATSPGYNCVALVQKRVGYIDAKPQAAAQGAPVEEQWYTDAIGETWLSMADKLAASIVSSTSFLENDKMVTQVRWYPVNRSTTTDQTQLQIWDASEMIFKVKGVSHLNLQNRTEGGDGTSAENALVTSIYANPLEGRIYEGKGSGFRLKHIGLAGEGALNAQLVCESTTGYFANGGQNTAFSDVARDVMKQPPNPRYFYSVTKSARVRLEPGAIKKHYLSATESHTLNGWMQVLYHWITSGATLDGVESPPGQVNLAVLKYPKTKPGVCGMIALEKVADIGSANLVVTAFERDAQYYSKLTFRRRRFTPATNSQMIENTLPE